MGSIRINELARELEVKSRAVLDCLPEIGITEKKSHSSSLDQESADRVRAYFRGEREPSESAPPKQAEAAPVKAEPLPPKANAPACGCCQPPRQTPGNSDGAPVIHKIDCGNQGGSEKNCGAPSCCASGACSCRTRIAGAGNVPAGRSHIARSRSARSSGICPAGCPSG